MSNMINRNMEMIVKMEQSFSYSEYVGLCKETEVAPASEQNFYSGRGVLEGGKTKYPELSLQEAYTKTLKDLDNAPVEKSCCVKKPKEEIKPLGVLDTVKSLGKSVKDHVKNKLRYVSNEEANRRLSVCSKCPKFKEGLKCSMCHCYMGIKATWDIEGICKLKKW